MPFRILIAASPSFNDTELFHNKLNALLCNKPERELYVVTHRTLVRLCCEYEKNTIIHQRDFFMHGKDATMEQYNKILPVVQGVIVFWDGETWNEKHLIQSASVKCVVVRYKSLKQQLEEEKIEKKGRKKITVPLSKEAKEKYCAAHEEWFKIQYPTAYKDGHYCKPKIPVINSGSRMDFFIVNFIVWSGWSATKIAVMQKIKGKYIASGAKKGTFDVSATIKGKSIKVETKHGSDKPSEEQLKMQARERNAGAIAEFVYTIDEFFILYDKIVNDENI